MRRYGGPENGRWCESRPCVGAEWTSELQGENVWTVKQTDGENRQM